MVDTVGSNPTAQGSLPAAHQATPVLERSVATQGEVQTPNYSAAYSELALTPTAIGAAASNVIMQTSSELAAIQGYELAKKNPNLPIIPTFAKSDAAFANAYKSQSASILGLDAQKLLDTNLEQLAQYDTLTPDLIASFAKSSATGIQEILKNAPDDVRVSLTNQYAQNLESQAHRLNMSMIGQQKETATKQGEAFRLEQTSIVQDALRDNTPQSLEVAAQTKASIDNGIDVAESTGQLSATQARASHISNKLNYESGIQINNALAARDNGTLERFLVDLGDKKLPGLTWGESEAVQNNVLKAVSQVERASRRNEQLTLAQGNNLIQTGRMTPDILESMRSDLTPTEFVNMSTAYSVSTHRKGANTQKVDFLISNAGDARAYDGATKDHINAAFDSLTGSVMENAKSSGTPVSADEAQAQVAAFMAHPIPKYIDGINNGIMSGSSEQAMSSMKQYHRLHAESGFKATGVSSKAVATSEMFLATQGQYPGNPDEALKQARDIVSNKDEATISLNKQKISEYYQRHASTTTTLQSSMIKMSGLGSGDYQDLTSFTADMRNHFDAYMQYTNGNEEISKKMTSDYAYKAYAETHINGEKEMGYLPVDSAIGIPVKGTALIQSDIYEKLGSQFEVGKQAFDNGTLDSYWRLAERVRFDEYAAAKTKVGTALTIPGYIKAARAKMSSKDELQGKSNITVLRESLRPERDIIAEYESAKPIEAEQVMRNGEVNSYHIQTRSSSMTSVSSATGQVVGPYLIQVKDPVTGVLSNIHSYFGATRTMPEYRPDAQGIRSRYLALNGLTQTWDEFKKSQDKQAAALATLQSPLTRPRHVGGL